MLDKATNYCLEQFHPQQCKTRNLNSTLIATGYESTIQQQQRLISEKVAIWSPKMPETDLERKEGWLLIAIT